ncbi:MAG: alpha-1,2-fucosyltransferase [Acidobacteriota bacterium]
MIVMKMQGGLGNQFFQYAAGRALSARLGCRLLLDISWYRDLPKGATPRAWELGRYPIQADYLDPMDSRSPWFWSMERIGCVVKADAGWRWARSFRERGIDHDPRVHRLGRWRSLEGYWQSPMYFDTVGQALRRELQPIDVMGEEDAKVASRIMADRHRAVAVHVRRGDYLLGVHAEHHGLCGMDYYRRAFECIREHIADPLFFVFSDDPQWVASQRDLFGDAVLVTHNGADAAFQDLRLMSLCRGHVIANSSFSWWGAWLTDSPNAKVVAPARWLANGAATPTLTPPEWVRL